MNPTKTRCTDCEPGTGGCSDPRACSICGETFTPKTHNPFFVRVCLPCLHLAIEEVTR